MHPTATGRGPRPAAPPAGAFSALSTPVTPTHTLLLDGDPTVSDKVAVKRESLRRYFHQTCEIYDRLFALIRDDASYYVRHEPLRHPLIFYFAHPAVFYVNKLTAGRLIPARLDPKLESMMAVGVDEMSWDDLNTEHYEWPAVQTVRDYRLRVREVVDDLIETMPLELPIRWESPAWMILMGIEHERIHLETSSVIMRMMPLEALRGAPDLTEEERQLWAACCNSGKPPANEWLPVAGRTIRLGKPETDRTYGWDNEYGHDEVSLPAFSAARRLVSNAEFMAFVEAGGYRQESFWTEEGRGWLHYTKARHPRFWLERGGSFSSETFWRRSRCPSTGLPRSTVWRPRPTAVGWRSRPAKTCSCPPRPIGTPSARMPWLPPPASWISTSPRGRKHPATSIWRNSPRPVR